MRALVGSALRDHALARAADERRIAADLGDGRDERGLIVAGSGEDEEQIGAPVERSQSERRQLTPRASRIAIVALGYGGHGGHGLR